MTDPPVPRHPTDSEALEAVLRLHQPRQFAGDGYSWTVCVEDRQAWPCATWRAITDPPE